MTHQQRLQGVPAPNRTLAQSSVFVFVRSRMTRILLSCLPLPAIKEPVYASCRVACSNMAKRIPAVHCVNECSELKCSKYLFLPAVDTLRTFWRGWESWACVGKVSIYAGVVSQPLGLHQRLCCTILIEASAKLMKVGATSPSSPATSSAAASHNDNTVPTSWAKHSVHVLSACGRPSTALLAHHNLSRHPFEPNPDQLTYASPDR